MFKSKELMTGLSRELKYLDYSDNLIHNIIISFVDELIEEQKLDIAYVIEITKKKGKDMAIKEIIDTIEGEVRRRILYLGLTLSEFVKYFIGITFSEKQLKKSVEIIVNQINETYVLEEDKIITEKKK